MGVVFIHVSFPGVGGIIISKLAQFAVPTFFMIAGYYAYGQKEEKLTKRLKRILWIFVYAYVCFCYIL